MGEREAKDHLGRPVADGLHLEAVVVRDRFLLRHRVRKVDQPQLDLAGRAAGRATPTPPHPTDATLHGLGHEVLGLDVGVHHATPV